VGHVLTKYLLPRVVYKALKVEKNPQDVSMLVLGRMPDHLDFGIPSSMTPLSEGYKVVQITISTPLQLCCALEYLCSNAVCLNGDRTGVER
jgi:hypothetical protein